MRLLLPLLLATLLSACTHTYYKEMKNSADELSAMKTFSWENAGGTSGDANQDIFDKAFEESFTAQLHNKGYQTATGTADFTVDYRISVVPTEITTTSLLEQYDGWRMGSNGEPEYAGWSTPNGRDELVMRGLVILTITRNSDKVIVWQAGAARAVDAEDGASTFKGHATSTARRIGKDIPKAK